MRVVGNAGSEDRKKFIATCAFALIVLAYVYFEFFRDSGTPIAAPPPPVIITTPAASSSASSEGGASTGDMGGVPGGPSAKVVGTTSAALDPTLHMEAMLVTESVVYGGNGRNIFSAQSAPQPVIIPKPVAQARLTPVVVPPPLPCPPNCPPPPPPPPIDLKFCGYFASGAAGDKKAILLHGEDVVLASPGDIVARRYRIISISNNSIQVEDMPNNNKQSLPLLAN